MYLENLKNEPWRGANFIVRPRAQNFLATPLQYCVKLHGLVQGRPEGEKHRLDQNW